MVSSITISIYRFELIYNHHSYFQQILFAFSSAPFYTKFVHLPTSNDVPPPEIRQSPKLWPFFKDVIRALDGSHIHCAPPASEQALHWNCKGFLLQNCLFACNFLLLFIYALTGWEGSATDACIWEDAVEHDLIIPVGKYFLTNVGFPLCNQLLIPYWGVHYHLVEWGCANIRPMTKEELFNLQHASAHNIIELIFGVLKHRFCILLLAPEYSLEIQAWIPAALCAVHNFIQVHDSNKGEHLSGPDSDDDFCCAGEVYLLRFHSLPTIFGHTPLFLTQTLDIILTSLWLHPHLWHHHYIIVTSSLTYDFISLHYDIIARTL